MLPPLFSDAPNVSNAQECVYINSGEEIELVSLKGANTVAQKVRIELLDDISGENADETVRFALDGTNYECDLTSEHSAELRDGLEKFIKAARKVTGATASARATRKIGSAGSNRDETQAIRLWAAEQVPPLNISSRGRISQDIVEKYKAAHAA